MQWGIYVAWILQAEESAARLQEEAEAFQATIQRLQQEVAEAHSSQVWGGCRRYGNQRETSAIILFLELHATPSLIRRPFLAKLN